jgi:phosphate transport system permease protein
MSTLDHRGPLTPSGNLARRKRVDFAMRATATAAAALAVLVLAIVVGSVLINGASSLSWTFITTGPPLFPSPTGPIGGIAPELIGTLLIVAFATAMAVPFGVLTAIFLSEFAKPRVGRPIRLALDLLNGMPSIVTAVFVYGLIVAVHGNSGIAASVALAIIMLPLIARATQEVLRLVPQSQRDAAAALGISKWRTTLGVVLPSAIGGILTGTVLAVARGAGETAPVLLLSSLYGSGSSVRLNMFSNAMPNIPVQIFQFSQQATPTAHAAAWGAALILMAMILIASLSARYLHARSRRKMFR